MAREADLLPVQYFHVVFTLTSELDGLVMRNHRILYDLLFRASSETLKELAADPKYLGAEIGFLSILHTCGQNLIAISNHRILSVQDGPFLSSGGITGTAPRKRS